MPRTRHRQVVGNTAMPTRSSRHVGRTFPARLGSFGTTADRAEICRTGGDRPARIRVAIDTGLQEDRFRRSVDDRSQVVDRDRRAVRCPRSGGVGGGRLCMGALVPSARSKTRRVGASDRVPERGRLYQGARPAGERGSQSDLRHGRRGQDQGGESTGAPRRTCSSCTAARPATEGSRGNASPIPWTRGEQEQSEPDKPGYTPRGGHFERGEPGCKSAGPCRCQWMGLPCPS